MKKEQTEELSAALIALLGLGTIVFLMVMSASFFGQTSDFPEYYSPARLIFEGHGAAGYSMPDLEIAQHKSFPSLGVRTIPLFVPPPGLALLSPLGLFSPGTATVVWKALCVLSIAIALVFVSKTCSLSRKQMLWLIAGVSLSDALYEALRIDQLAPILLLAFAGAIYDLQRKKDVRAGFWLSLVVLKPQQFIPFLAFLLGAKRWKPLMVFVSCQAVLCVISLLQIGVPGWQAYFALLALPGIVRLQQPELTPTLRGQLLRLAPAHSGAIMVVTSVVYFAVIALSFFWGRKFRSASDYILLALLIVMPVALVTSVHCHSYDLLVLVPTVVAMFKDKPFETSSKFKLILLFAGFIFMLPFSINIHYDYLLKGGLLNPCFFALLLLAVTCCALVYKNDKGANEAERSSAQVI